ncbi:hypothetical protein [Eubacterium aggregans]
MVDFSRFFIVHKPTDIDDDTNVAPLTLDDSACSAASSPARPSDLSFRSP